jgi:hypothetical protein
MTAWMESRDQHSAKSKQTERAAATKATQKVKAEDLKALGPLFAELAAVIRKNVAKTERSKSLIPAALKRHKRRRRLKAD